MAAQQSFNRSANHNQLARQLESYSGYNDNAMSNTQSTEADDSLQRELAALELQVQAQGHKFYGIFADDPGALEVFDEIERLRDQPPLATAPMPSAP